MGDLRDKLRRLGVQKGARSLKSPPKPPTSIPDPAPDSDGGRDDLSLQTLFPHGRMVSNRFGQYFLIERITPLNQMFGHHIFGAYTTFKPETIAVAGNDPSLATVNVQDLLFLDIETSGIAGASVFPFLVGVAFADVDKEAFVLRLYACRDAGDETAMLFDLGRLLDEKSGLVTYNGRGFDAPLLDNRFFSTGLP